MAKAHADGDSSWLRHIIRKVFALEAEPVDAIWAVFFIPAAILVFWALLDWWLIKDTPEEAHFPHLDTADASSGQMDAQFTVTDLLRKVFTSRLMLLFALVELTSGVLRNGIMQWYLIFAKEVKQPGTEFFVNHWGLLLCFFGILGAFISGLISDKFFESRRGPPAAMCCGFMFVMAGLMAVYLFSSPLVVGSAAILISMAVLMSGTAAADFGGRKATATCSGIVDGFVYLGSGLQSVCLGYLTSRSWLWWPIFLMPFAVLGGFIALRIWHELPAATRRYIAQFEEKTDVESVL